MGCAFSSRPTTNSSKVSSAIQRDVLPQEKSAHLSAKVAITFVDTQAMRPRDGPPAGTPATLLTHVNAFTDPRPTGPLKAAEAVCEGHQTAAPAENATHETRIPNATTHEIRGISPAPASSNQSSDNESADGAADDLYKSDTERTLMTDGQKVQTLRRIGVSAEQHSSTDEKDWTPPCFTKTEEERASLKDMLRHSEDGKMHMLFGLVSNKTIEQVIDAFDAKKVAHGESVITQGAEGDFFYVVKSGSFDIFVKSSHNNAPRKVFEAGKGFAFGELALLYNAPRTATITAREESVVWMLDRQSFRMLVVNAQREKWKEYSKFLTECEMFKSFHLMEIQQLAELIKEEDFETDEAIVEQGERDDKMFILLSGSAVACIKGDKGEFEVKHYVPGQFFGEVALLEKGPRLASVYAKEKSTCLYIDRDSFRRVLGPVEDILSRCAHRYAKYEQYLKKGLQRKFTLEAEGLDVDEEKVGAQGHTVRRPRHSLRVAASGDLSDAGACKPPVTTFKEKLADDFSRPALVGPTSKFIVPDARFHLFFTPTAGGQFTDQSPFIVRTEAKSSVANDFCTYRYQNSGYQLKESSVCSVFCQKGQKPGFEPTPNQDNMFALTTKSGVDIYGVCDGHGPFGHIVSFRLVQTVPYYLTTNANFHYDKKLATTEALEQAQADLRKFAQDEDLNFDASGSTCSLLILEEQKIHIATVGDSRIMISSYNRHDSRVIKISEDHKPDIPEEKARIEATGNPPGEVRDGRIYIKDEIYPGLTMSRAMGDFCCAARGVIQEPSYSCIAIQPGDEWYALVASDGIWEFLDGDTATRLSAKKLRLKGASETMRYLIAASRKRWQHIEGEYCDDVSGMLIQWNSKDKTEESGEATSTHSVHVQCSASSQ